MASFRFSHGPNGRWGFLPEEPSMHVHVAHPGGEAKFWLEPGVTLAGHTGLSPQELTAVAEVVLRDFSDR
ncbi:MAG: DUF4160 domain-containing protein [Zoogloea sp.]|nr:DUF4160 domain-containing protein [Zoogloea sp.]